LTLLRIYTSDPRHGVARGDETWTACPLWLEEAIRPSRPAGAGLAADGGGTTVKVRGGELLISDGAVRRDQGAGGRYAVIDVRQPGEVRCGGRQAPSLWTGGGGGACPPDRAPACPCPSRARQEPVHDAGPDTGQGGRPRSLTSIEPVDPWVAEMNVPGRRITEASSSARQRPHGGGREREAQHTS